MLREVRPLIVVDSKEASKAKEIVESLRALGARLEVKGLTVGDYLASEELGIERKTANDFVNTLTKRDLFMQLFLLKAAYPKALLIIEGDLRSVLRFRRIHPNSVYGALASLARGGIAVVPTTDKLSTARLIYLIARQEQSEGRRPGAKVVKKFESVEERQLALLCSLPGIGRERAEAILKVYKTPLNALNSFRNWAKRVKGIGTETVKKVEEVLTAPFNQEKKPSKDPPQEPWR